MSQVSTDWTCPFAARCERRQAGAQPSEGVQPPKPIMDSYQTVLPLGIFRNAWEHQNDSWGLWIPAVCGKFYQRVPKLGSRMSAEVEGSRRCVSVRWMALAMSRISANQNFPFTATFCQPPSAPRQLAAGRRSLVSQPSAIGKCRACRSSDPTSLIGNCAHTTLKCSESGKSHLEVTNTL